MLVLQCAFHLTLSITMTIVTGINLIEGRGKPLLFSMITLLVNIFCFLNYLLKIL